MTLKAFLPLYLYKSVTLNVPCACQALSLPAIFWFLYRFFDGLTVSCRLPAAALFVPHSTSAGMAGPACLCLPAILPPLLSLQQEPFSPLTAIAMRMPTHPSAFSLFPSGDNDDSCCHTHHLLSSPDSRVISNRTCFPPSPPASLLTVVMTAGTPSLLPWQCCHHRSLL